MEFKKYDRVIMRDTTCCRHWKATIYGEKRNDGKFISANGVVYNECLPLEGYEHFIGTTLTFFMPKEGDVVLVRDNDGASWTIAVFVGYDEGAEYPYLTHSNFYDDEGMYDCTGWRYCKGFIKPVKEG